MANSMTKGAVLGVQSTLRPAQMLSDAARPVPFSSGVSARSGKSRRAQINGAAAKSDKHGVDFGAAVRNGVLGLAAAATLALPVTFAPQEMMPQAQAGLLSKDAVTNARALLRYALPIDEKQAKPIRQVQEELEAISEQLRVPGSKPLGPISKNVRKASSILGNNKAKLEAAFNPSKKADGVHAIQDLENSLRSFSAMLENDTNVDRAKQEVPFKQQEALLYVGRIEEAMVQGFPFKVPEQYNNLPQLLGRATLEMDVSLAEVRNKGKADGKLRMVVDGYNAPLTAGNFVDLVDKKFYDGMDIQRADGFVVQTGDPLDEYGGYVDPNTKEVRRIPFEIMVEGDKEPVYEENLEDNGRFNEQPVLPFNAYGTMALARSEFETNSGSSQIFWLLKESELTPTGSNLLDGRYAVFGYVVDGQAYLQDMQVGDKINRIYIVDGLENLKRPKVPEGPKATPTLVEDTQGAAPAEMQ